MNKFIGIIAVGIWVLVAALGHLCLPNIVLPASPAADCAKTFTTSKGKEVVLRKLNKTMTDKQMRATQSSEDAIYVLNNKTGRDNYTLKEPPSWSQNCAGLVMGRVFNIGKYNYNVDALLDDIIAPYGQNITRIGQDGEGTELVEKGDILRYPSPSGGKGSDHVAYVENVTETTDAFGKRRKILIIHSKCDEESIYEIEIRPGEWWHDPLAYVRYGLPYVYRVSPGAVTMQPKYPGSGDCDSQELVVEVLDKTSNAISGATVEVVEGGPAVKAPTGPDGSVRLQKYRGMDQKITVSKNDYVTATDEIVQSQFTRWTVFLEKKPDVYSITKMLEGEIAKLIQLRDGAKIARESAETHIGGSRGQDVKDAEELLRLLNERTKKIEQANNDCIQAQSYITQATADAGKASTARNAAITQASAISSRVGSCKSKADVDSLEKAWESASKEGGTALAFGARAEGTIGKVNNTISRAQAAAASLSTSTPPPDPSIKYIMERLARIKLPDKAYYDRLASLIKDANTKKAVFEKAKEDLIWKIAIDRGKMGTGHESVFDALTARVRAIQLEEKDMSALSDSLLTELRTIYNAKKEAGTVHNVLIKLPLCSTVNRATLTSLLQEAKKAQSDIVQYVTSDLLQKISDCRAKLNLPQSGQQTAAGQVPITKPWTGWGIHPRRVTLALGQSQPFTATVVYSDGQDVDITQWCAWSPSQVFKADKIGTWLVKAEVKLDVVRTDYAEIRVPGTFSISGPDKGSPGTRATFRVTGPGLPPGSKDYQFRWSGDGKQFASTTDSQVISLQTPGKHVITAKVWNWSGAAWMPVGEESKAVLVEDSSGSGSATGSYTKGSMIGSAQIPGKNPKPTRVAGVLEKGKPYIVVGKGSVSLWDGQTDGCDSVFRYKTPLEKNGGPLKIWGQLKLINPTAHLSDLIRQQTGKDPVYNPGHAYEAVIIGQGLQFDAVVHDGGTYEDNHGELTVEVYEAIPK